MQLPHINIKSPTFIKLTTLLIVLFIIFVPKGNFLKLFSNGNSGIATAFITSQDGNWNDNDTWNVSVPTYTPLHGPYGIALSSTTGKIYVADNDHLRVVVLNPDGTFFAAYNNSDAIYPSPGFSNLGDITLDSSDNIYVADGANFRIVILNPDGTASTSYDGSASTTLGSFFPTGLAVSQAGKIYVTDGNGSNRIIVFNSDGTVFAQYDNLDATYPTPGLAFPQDIALSPTGEMYITDSTNQRIVVLNANGTASTSYNGSVFSPGGFGPQGITLSPTGYIYVTNPTWSNDIIVLSPGGSLFAAYDSTASSTFGGTNYSFYIALSPTTGEIYVTDYLSYHVNVFNSDGTASSTYTGGRAPRREGIEYPGSSDDIMISQLVTLTNNQSVHNIILSSGGNLDLNGHTLNVYGDWSNTGGTLTNNGGTVDFKGTSTQHIIGANTFENLTKIVATASSLLFDPNNTTTITGDLILSGALGNLLSVGPSITTPVFSSKIDGTINNPGLGAPYDVAISTTTNTLYTVDSLNDRVLLINSDGRVSRSYDLPLGSAPRGIHLSSTGEIYVANYGYSRIDILNPDGTASTSFDGQASTTLGGLNPSDFDISPTGKIYVADDGNARVIIFNPDGSVFAQYDGSASTTLGSFQPEGIALSPSGEIYIGDTNGRIVVLNPDGTASTTFDGSASTTLGSFNPDHLDISSTGKIYISDAANNRIIVLNADGSVFAQYDNSDASYSPTGFSGARGIKLSPTGEIYVADAFNSRIVVLNADGTASTTYDNTIKNGIFTYPNGAITDSQDNIYVTDDSNNVIQEFDLNGNFVKTLDTTGIPAPITDMNFLGVDGSDNIYTVNQTTKRLIKFVNGSYSASIILPAFVYGFAVSPDGHIYVNDGSGTVYEFDQSFNQVASTSEADGISFNLYGPMAIDRTGNFLYVVDTNFPGRVLKLNTSDLSFVASLPTDPLGISLTSIDSLTFDSHNNIYVNDFNNNNVTVFSPDFGAQLAQFGSSGNNDGEFGFSLNDQMTIDLQDNLYVVDSNNNRIQKFSPGNLTPFTINYTGSATTSYSYLSVASSTNTSSSPFSCLVGCTDGGANTNWIFSTTPAAPVSYGGSSSYTSPLTPIPTPEGTTTPEVSTITPEVIPPSTPKPPHFTFTQTLKFGSIGEEVRQLQIFLNNHGFFVSKNETTFFGTKTKQAVIKFQETYRDDILTPQNLIRGTGIFLNYSRAKVNSILENE